jgi:hypothetical protein
VVFAKVVRRLVCKILSDVGNFVVQLRDFDLGLLPVMRGRCAKFLQAHRWSRERLSSVRRAGGRCRGRPRAQRLAHTVDELNWIVNRSRPAVGFYLVGSRRSSGALPFVVYTHAARSESRKLLIRTLPSGKTARISISPPMTLR